MQSKWVSVNQRPFLVASLVIVLLEMINLFFIHDVSKNSPCLLLAVGLADGEIHVVIDGVLDYRIIEEGQIIRILLNGCRAKIDPGDINGKKGSQLRGLRWAQHKNNIVWVVLEFDNNKPRYKINENNDFINIKLLNINDMTQGVVYQQKSKKIAEIFQG